MASQENPVFKSVFESIFFDSKFFLFPFSTSNHEDIFLPSDFPVCGGRCWWISQTSKWDFGHAIYESLCHIIYQLVLEISNRRKFMYSDRFTNNFCPAISSIINSPTFPRPGEATRLLAEAGPWLGFGCFVGAQRLEDFRAEVWAGPLLVNGCCWIFANSSASRWTVEPGFSEVPAVSWTCGGNHDLLDPWFSSKLNPIFVWVKMKRS